jgi:hypothetical protein
MSIKKWTRKGTEPPTHVLMDGGQLHVPDTDLEAFYRAYLADIACGTRLFVVEQKTEIFKFFVDIDFKAERPLTDEDALDLCTRICASVKNGKCLVARAPHRKLKDGEIKSGFHLHWPDLAVTRQEALSLRTRILMDLDGPEWARIIDSSVYGGSGLRCLWSHKKPEGAPYVPWISVPDGTPMSPRPTLEALKLFAVRVSGQPTAPKIRRVASSPGAIGVCSSRLEEFIRVNFEGQGSARVKGMRNLTGNGKGLCIETDSRYCENIKGLHKSNHVWFCIRGGVIMQKCLDDECLEFSGREHNLPPSISDEGHRVASPPCHRAVDLLPKTWSGSFQEF